MKFLLIRSFSGFGDRIEHLLAAFNYCVKSERTMVIDWTDPVWCGEEFNKGFDYYFRLKKVSYMPLSEFKKIFITNKKNGIEMKILPSFFENIILKRSNENDVQYTFSDLANLMKEVINNERPDIPCDILVTTDLDKRNNMGIIAIPNLIYNYNIMNYIKEDPNYSFLMNNNFVSLHLRGTDRTTYTEKYRPDLTNFSHNQDEYISNLIKKIPEDTENILLLSDSNILIEAFLEKIDKKFNIIQTNNQKSDNEVSLHLKMEKSKESKNFELLKDFYFMTRSKFVVCDTISRFSLVAHRVCELGKPKEQRLKT